MPKRVKTKKMPKLLTSECFSGTSILEQINIGLLVIAKRYSNFFQDLSRFLWSLLISFAFATRV